MKSRFEEHKGQLFRMLEEPEPLTEFSHMPCVIRRKQGILTDILTEYSTNPTMSILGELFEIIGYPVEEGSRWWALYQMMQRKKVCHHKSPSIVYCKHADDIYQASGEIYNCVDYMSASAWLNGADKNGWQLYKEPKPEPAKEPEIVAHKQHANCLVCGKEIEGLLDGHATVSIKRYSISSLYESTYSHYCGKCFLELGFDATERELRNRQQPIAEPEPAKEQFKVGDWVEVQGKQCEITNSSVAGETPITGIGIDIYGTTHIFKIEDITRKLEFNEVVVHFPGIRPGTVEAISDECFALKSEYGVAIIMFNMLYARQFHLIKKLLGMKH